jgi:hypothetical protein
MRASLLAEFEGNAVTFEDFFCRLVAEVSPALIGRSRMPEQSAIPRSRNPRNRLLTMPIRFQKPAFDTLLQVANGGIAAESPALQDNEQLSRFKSVAIVEFFDAHWFPLKGNREVIRDFPLQETGSSEENAHEFKISLTRSFVTKLCNEASQTESECRCGYGRLQYPISSHSTNRKRVTRFQSGHYEL